MSGDPTHSEPAIHDPPSSLPAGDEATVVRTLKSEDLFAGSRMIWIDHSGSLYRLLITSRGKLILQK